MTALNNIYRDLSIFTALLFCGYVAGFIFRDQDTLLFLLFSAIIVIFYSTINTTPACGKELKQTCELYNKCSTATNACTDILSKYNNITFTKLGSLSCDLIP